MKANKIMISFLLIFIPFLFGFSEHPAAPISRSSAIKINKMFEKQHSKTMKEFAQKGIEPGSTEADYFMATAFSKAFDSAGFSMDKTLLKLAKEKNIEIWRKMVPTGMSTFLTPAFSLLESDETAQEAVRRKIISQATMNAMMPLTRKEKKAQARPQFNPTGSYSYAMPGFSGTMIIKEINNVADKLYSATIDTLSENGAMCDEFTVYGNWTEDRFGKELAVVFSIKEERQEYKINVEFTPQGAQIVTSDKNHFCGSAADFAGNWSKDSATNINNVTE